MASSTIVPYGAPTAATPPPTQGAQPAPGSAPVPGGGTPSGGQDPGQVEKILAMLRQRLQQPQLAQPVPAPIAQPKAGAPTGSGPGWGFERFANQIGGHIQQAVANQKQAQLAKAESDWGQFNAAVQAGKGDMWLAQNEKAAKNMAKALNQDWLNPEKTNVYKTALDNYTKQQQAKGKAASGLQSLVKHLIGRAQNPQLTDDQKQAIAKEQMSKAPMVQPGIDKESMSVINEELKAQNAADLESQKESGSEKKQKDEQEFQAFKQEQTQKHQDLMDQNRQSFTERMDRLREFGQETRQSRQQEAMFKALGIRLSDQDKKAMEIKPSQVNAEVTSTINDMRRQASEMQTSLNKIQDQASKSRWYHPYQEAGQGDVNQAKQQLDNLNLSIQYLKENRSKIASGEMSLDDATNTADTISHGTPPGFK